LDRPQEEQKVLPSCWQPSLGVHVGVVDEKNNDVEPGAVGEIISQTKTSGENTQKGYPVEILGE